MIPRLNVIHKRSIILFGIFEDIWFGSLLKKLTDLILAINNMSSHNWSRYIMDMYVISVLRGYIIMPYKMVEVDIALEIE